MFYGVKKLIIYILDWKIVFINSDKTTWKCANEVRTDFSVVEKTGGHLNRIIYHPDRILNGYSEITVTLLVKSSVGK